MKIAYLGPINSYSHMACKQILDKTSKAVPYNDFYSVMTSVPDECDKCIVPIENSTEGTVNDCLDTLVWDTSLNITKEVMQTIDNRLIISVDGDFDNIQTIITHPQAFAQCKRYIKKHFPQASVLLTQSTSKAVKSVDKFTAAIAGSQNLSEGLKISDFSVNDNAYNCTRFVILESKPNFSTSATKISVVFETENKPGALLNKLQILSDNGLNMTKIESRPHKTVLGRYIFFVDFTGNVSDPNVKNTLTLLSKQTEFFRLLGNY